MGCGSSRTVETGDNGSKASFSHIGDQNLKNYYTLIKSGVLFLDYTDLNKDGSHKEMEPISLNGTTLVYKSFKGKENVSKYLSKPAKMLKMRDHLKKTDKHNELGVFYNNNEEMLIIYLIFNNTAITYEEDLSQIISTNKHLEKLEIKDTFPFFLMIKLIKSLKLNETIKSLVVNTTDDYILNSLIHNLTNSSLEKLALSKLGLTDDSVKHLEDYFKYNLNLKKLKLDKNNFKSLDTVKSSLGDLVSHLTSINVSTNKLTNFTTLGEILMKNSQLQKLNLSKIQIANEEQFKYIFSSTSIEKFSNLLSLDLSFNNVSVTILSELVKKCKNLNKLVLNKVEPFESDSEVIKEFGKCYITSQIEHLHFNFNGLNNKLFIEGISNAPDSEITHKNKKMKLFKTTLDNSSCNLLFKKIAKTDAFKELDLSYVNISDYEALQSNLAGLKNLTSLNMSNCELNNEKMLALSSLISKNSSITQLNIEKNSFNNLSEAMQVFCDSLSKNTTLVKLNLNYTFDEKSDEAFAYFCSHLKGNFKEISIENCKFPYDTFGELFSQFIANNLEVKVWKFGSKDDMFKTNNNLILKALADNVKLEDLSVTNIKLNQDCLKEFLMVSTGLRKLNLDNVCVNTSYFEALASLKQLQTLNISGYSFTHNDHLGVIRSLLTTHKLENLNLSFLQITAEQMEIVIEGLKMNKTLKTFNVFPQENLPHAFIKSIQNFYAYAKDCPTLTSVPILTYFNEGETKQVNLPKDLETYFNI